MMCLHCTFHVVRVHTQGLNEQCAEVEGERRAIVAEQEQYAKFWGSSDVKHETKIQELREERDK